MFINVVQWERYFGRKWALDVFVITRFHGRSVTEIWGRNKIRNGDLWVWDKTKSFKILGDENSKLVTHARNA